MIKNRNNVGAPGQTRSRLARVIGAIGVSAMLVAAGCGVTEQPGEPETATIASAVEVSPLQALADEIADWDAEAKAAWHAWKALWDEYTPLAHSRVRTAAQCTRMLELQPEISAALERMRVSSSARDLGLVRYNTLARSMVVGKPAGGPTHVAVTKVGWGLMGRLLGKAVVVGGHFFTLRAILETPSAADLEAEQAEQAAAQCSAEDYDPSSYPEHDIPRDTGCFAAATQLASTQATILEVYGTQECASTEEGTKALKVLRWKAFQYARIVNHCAEVLGEYDIDAPGFEPEDQIFDPLTCPADGGPDPMPDSGDPTDGDPTDGES